MVLKPSIAFTANAVLLCLGRYREVGCAWAHRGGLDGFPALAVAFVRFHCQCHAGANGNAAPVVAVFGHVHTSKEGAVGTSQVNVHVLGWPYTLDGEDVRLGFHQTCGLRNAASEQADAD